MLFCQYVILILNMYWKNLDLCFLYIAQYRLSEQNIIIKQGKVTLFWMALQTFKIIVFKLYPGFLLTSRTSQVICL